MSDPVPNPDSCCGNFVPCCDNGLPEVLTAKLTNVTGCTCIDGEVVTLRWDKVLKVWSGAGTGALCAAQAITWKLSCGGSDCSGFSLVAVGGVCIAMSITLDAGCNCKDANGKLALSFTVQLVGLGCCDPPSGGGTIKVAITS